MTENKRGGKEDDGDNRKKQDLKTECGGLKRQEKSWNGKQRLITDKHSRIRISKFYKMRSDHKHCKSNDSTDAPPHIWEKNKIK